MSAFSVRVVLGAMAITACHSPTNVTRPDSACLVAALPIRIAPTDTSVRAGDTLRLLAVVNTSDCYAGLELNEGVRWGSSDTMIAVVDAVTGVITARTPGKVVINAHPIPTSGFRGQATVTVTP